MDAEFCPATIRNIAHMQRMSKSLPDDFMFVGAMQNLAQFIADVDAFLTDDQKAVLLGCGALLIREGEKELKAEIQAGLAIAKARQPREDEHGR
jgi:glutaredoxin-related protein